MSSGVGFFCFHALGDTKTKETYPTRPGSPTPCKQGLSHKDIQTTTINENRSLISSIKINNNR